MNIADQRIIVEVALPVPLRKIFDYHTSAAANPQPGMRVRVHFGTRVLIGVIVGLKTESNYAAKTLKPIDAILDATPILPADVLACCQFAADYYHHPLGEILIHALPLYLRKHDQIEYRSPILKKYAAAEIGPELNLQQQQVIATIEAQRNQFKCFLLQGITGSGKTEVYLAVIDAILRQGQQALIMVPEIALTPQTAERIQRRFPVPVAVLHSGLATKQRALIWLQVAQGEIKLLVGTRSCVFTPFQNLGLIVIDEEHENTFKQQDGFRYSGRDLAIWRAKQNNIPIILGSATPSLETVNNTQLGRYQHLILSERAGAGLLPKIQFIDIRQHKLTQGICQPILEQCKQQLANGKQVMFFLNRRGYSPVLMCYDCGWLANCKHCDARQTYHLDTHKLICHHCGQQQTPPLKCPECKTQNLHPLGAGTQRIEDFLAQQFQNFPIIRVDSDSIRRKGALAAQLDKIHSNEPCVIVGTQILAKGHHFANLALVVIIDADAGLFSTDYRAPERTIQLMLQVAGRAGREDSSGEVLIQTAQPQHWAFAALKNHDYNAFAVTALNERKIAQLPPFNHLALLRASSQNLQNAQDFLQQASQLGKQLSQQFAAGKMQIFGPLPAPIVRKRGWHHLHCVINSPQRGLLQNFLQQWIPQIEALPFARKVRFAIDVDPTDAF